jgi:ribosomal protein L37AE/L43A
MGIHSYNCPTCQSIQRVKAQAGEVVEIKSCEACEQEIARLSGAEEALEHEEALRETNSSFRASKAQRK